MGFRAVPRSMNTTSESMNEDVSIGRCRLRPGADTKQSAKSKAHAED